MQIYVEYLLKELTDSDKEIALIDTWKDHINQVLFNPLHPSYAWVRKQYDIILGEESEATLRRKMKEIFVKTLQKLEDPFGAAAYFHMKLVALHPFIDGNGGVARLFVAALLSSHGYLPPVMWSTKEYMAIIQESKKKHDSTILADYLRKMVCKAESIFLDPDHAAQYKRLIDAMIEAYSQCLKDQSLCDGDFQKTCNEHIAKLTDLQNRSTEHDEL